MTEVPQGIAIKTLPLPVPGRLHANLQSSIAIGLILPAIGGFVLLAVNTWPYTVDDAFITFRYAENLSSGWGLSFNRGDSPRRGLHVAVVDARHGGSTCAGNRRRTLLETRGHVADAWYRNRHRDGRVLRRRRRAAGRPILAAALAAVLFLSFPYCSAHCVSGMETALAALLYSVAAGVYLQLGERVYARRLLPLMCFLLGITRPEANLFCALLLAVSLLSVPKGQRANFIVWCFTCYVLPGTATSPGVIAITGCSFLCLSISSRARLVSRGLVLYALS